MNSIQVEDIESIWGSSFLRACEQLAASQPWLDDEELEAKAEELTNQFFYILEKESLPEYLRDISWRWDLK